MLLTKEVELEIKGCNKKYYKNLGYNVLEVKDNRGVFRTPKGTKIKVRTEDLPPNSNIKVKIKCDYCGEIFERRYHSFFNSHDITNKDACKKCKVKKFNESNLIIYGTEFPSQNEEIKMKVKSTNLKNLGVECVFQSPEIKEKMKENNLGKYGVEHTLQVQEFREKGKETMLKLYGVENPMQSKEIQEKAKQTNIKKHGVEYPMQSKDIMKKSIKTNLKNHGVEYNGQRKDVKEKIAKTFRKNNSQKTSYQQLEVYNMLKENNYNVELNYPISNVNLDVAIFIDDLKIDLEYDGWYWHQDGQKDRKRDEFLKSKGWKILRIRSGHKVPIFQEIKEAINKLINSNRTFTEIVLDDWKEEEVI